MSGSSSQGEKSVRVSSLLFNIMILLILVNNTLYQTKYQLNQPMFVLLIFLILIVFWVFGIEQTSKWFYICLYGLLMYMIGSLTWNYAEHGYVNRAMYNFMIACIYCFLFFAAPKKEVSSSYLYTYLAIFVAGGIYILLTSNRDLFNPNWYAMTIFYLLALVGPTDKKWVVFALAFIFYAVFESRGATVSAITAVAVILMQLYRRRYIASIGFVVLTGIFAYYIFYLYDSHLSGLVVATDITGDGRGLGGREGALIEGYSQLIESSYLGYGIGASTSFNVQDNAGIYKDVHVHFGVLDIALKFGVLGVLIVYVFSIRSIHLSNTTMLPYVLGGLLTVFYYNGLATSHVGLNFLLYLLLGKALAKKSGFFGCRRQIIKEISSRISS